MKNEQLKKLSKKMVAEPENFMHSFRRNLQVYIDEKDISLASIANEADISVETLKTLIYGKGEDCKLSTAIALAKALCLSVDELVGSGTLSAPMRESIAISRNLPDNFVSFLRWTIRYQERALSDNRITKKAVNIMYAECCDGGNLKMTSNYHLVDISDFPDEKRYKIYLGIRIPCEHYMPVFMEGDVLLLANDRKPMQNERIVVVNNGFLRVVRRKEDKDEAGNKRVGYYTVRKGTFMAWAEEVEEEIGYVVDVIHPDETEEI